MPGIEKKKKLSIITPLYNTPKGYLDDVLGCIKPYSDDVELVLVNDSPNNQRLSRWLKQIEDPHVTILYNERNMGIFAAYLNGFLHARGEYCCILDHDDIFDPGCVLPEIDNKPDLIYTDEYKFIDSGNGEKVKSDVFTKPDFDVLSTVFYYYTHHVTVLRTKILQRQLRNYSGKNNYTSIFDIHMLLEYMSAYVGKKMEIVHVPEAAYGWRIHENSTAMRLDQKLTSYFERVKKTEEFLARYGETPLLNIDKNVGYLVEGEFLSARDMVSFPLVLTDFQKKLDQERCFKGKELELRLASGKYSDQDYEHFLRVLLKLPMKYLQAQKCFPIIIPGVNQNARIDTYNFDRHVPNVPFLSKATGDGTGLRISDISTKNEQKIKYSVLIK